MAVEHIAAEFAHVLFGMMWVGTSIYIEVVIAPIMRKAKNVGEYRHMLGLLGKTSRFQGISALLVLLTGIVYLLILYPVDAILTQVSGQIIIVALVLVLATIVSGFAFLSPTAMKIVKTPWPEDSTAPVPDPVRSLEKRLWAGSMASAILVVVVLVLMIVAAWS